VSAQRVYEFLERCRLHHPQAQVLLHDNLIENDIPTEVEVVDKATRQIIRSQCWWRQCFFAAGYQVVGQEVQTPAGYDPQIVVAACPLLDDQEPQRGFWAQVLRPAEPGRDPLAELEAVVMLPGEGGARTTVLPVRTCSSEVLDAKLRRADPKEYDRCVKEMRRAEPCGKATVEEDLRIGRLRQCASLEVALGKDYDPEEASKIFSRVALQMEKYKGVGEKRSQETSSASLEAPPKRRRTNWRKTADRAQAHAATIIAAGEEEEHRSICTPAVTKKEAPTSPDHTPIPILNPSTMEPDSQAPPALLTFGTPLPSSFQPHKKEAPFSTCIAPYVIGALETVGGTLQELPPSPIIAEVSAILSNQQL
jgi:hypothetical protein